MTADEEAAVWRLRNVWSGSYGIDCCDGVFRAARCSAPPDIITANSAAEMTGLLQADYRQWMRTVRDQPTENPGSSR
jgi:hypothetical protein